uniref:Uncharacterized protein n=1 Tax=Eutreptiella gymnastica TaxID=73025 RepID=A0A7S4FWQ2_9EUGL
MRNDRNGTLRDWAPRKVCASLVWLPCHTVHLSPLIIILRPPLAGGVGGYNHHCIGEEGEWRPPLLYAERGRLQGVEVAQTFQAQMKWRGFGQRAQPPAAICW